MLDPCSVTLKLQDYPKPGSIDISGLEKGSYHREGQLTFHREKDIPNSRKYIGHQQAPLMFRLQH